MGERLLPSHHHIGLKDNLCSPGSSTLCVHQHGYNHENVPLSWMPGQYTMNSRCVRSSILYSLYSPRLLEPEHVRYTSLSQHPSLYWLEHRGEARRARLARGPKKTPELEPPRRPRRVRPWAARWTMQASVRATMSSYQCLTCSYTFLQPYQHLECKQAGLSTPHIQALPSVTSHSTPTPSQLSLSFPA